MRQQQISTRKETLVICIHRSRLIALNNMRMYEMLNYLTGVLTMTVLSVALVGCAGSEGSPPQASVLDFHSIGFTATDISAVKDGYGVPGYDLYNYDQLCDRVGFVEPKLLKLANPYYPKRVEQKGIMGRVIVREMLSNAGQVLYVAILKTDNHIFDREALFAAAQQEYLPATCHGKPIQMWIVFPFDFKLHQVVRRDSNWVASEVVLHEYPIRLVTA